MYIKQLIIQGFKTYKDHTVIDPFEQGLNVVLGRNGAGKSNLLDAVQFVLSDKYTNLRTEERQRLLYEGSGREVLAASVELIFDNTDGRIPSPTDIKRGQEASDEVSIKRSIGLKKDEYFVDGKHTSKQDLTNLLESAGMSKQNPYYIVEQGKINALIRMKDSERLDLLKEIAGTRTYDDRRKESKKIMRETDHKTAQVRDVIEFLDTRLSELVGEKQELDSYQKLDSRRRALEFSLFDNELQIATRKLAKIEDLRSNTDTSSTALHNQINALHAERVNAENERAEADSKVTYNRQERKRLDQQRRRLVDERSKLELTVQELQSQYDTEINDRKDAEGRLAELESKIADAQAEYERATAEYNARLQSELQHQQRIEQTQSRLNALYSKQSRKQQFKSKKERDAYLKKRITQQQRAIAAEEETLAELQQQRQAAQQQIVQTRKQIAEKSAEQERLSKVYQEESALWQELKRRRDSEMDALKKVQAEQAESARRHAGFHSATDKAEQEWARTVDRDTLTGLRSVEHLRAEGNITGIHGPLIELFQCDPTFYRCVEVTAGSALFSVVVESDVVAGQIINYLNEGDRRNPRGRLTFIPLNRLERYEPTYPKSGDILPMIDKLQFEPKFRQAMIQTFGKTVIARDMKVASEMAMQHDLNAITLHGDRVDKKGALTGGSHTERHSSRLESYSKVRKARDEDAKSETYRATLQQQHDELQQQVSQTAAEVQRLLDSHFVMQARIKQLKKDTIVLENQVPQLERSLEEVNRLIQKCETQLTTLRAELVVLQEELTTEMTAELSPAEQAELERLNTELTELQRSLTELQAARAQAEIEKEKASAVLFEDLLPERERLQSIVAGTALSVADQLNVSKEQLANVTQQVKDIQRQLKALDTEILQVNADLLEFNTRIDQLKQQEQELHATMVDESKEIEKLLSKRQLYSNKKDECTKKIRELGSLPADAYTKYRDKSTKDLVRLLEQVNAKLQGMTGINKKAADQYTSFSTQKKELEERKDELDEGRQAILQLIEHLDAKKDDAIQRTFKAIARHFSEVFKEIVPGGKATLQMLKPTPEAPHDEEEEKVSHDEAYERKQREEAGTLNYVGVGIKVSFPGDAGTSGGLSGGQESVVALSLIFAIQRCDPSPFYIFDEIDSALDPQYRQAVARMIGKQSENTQFITTTFHPEQLQVAQKFYGVTFRNKASHIRVITPTEAVAFMSIPSTEATRDARERPSPAYTSTAGESESMTDTEIAA